MKREKSGALSWLDRATGRIKFPPDRKAVRQELEDHIQDKADDLQRLYPDLSRGEAERMAIGQMGDAEEIGKDLAALHHPLLGWLWYGTRAILVLTILFVVLFVVLQPRFVDQIRDGDWETERMNWRYLGAQEMGGWTAPESVELEHYTLEVPAAARIEEKWQYTDGREPLTCQTAAIRLRLTAEKLWNRPGPENLGLEQGLSAVDASGREIRFERILPVDSWEAVVRGDEQPFAPGKQGWNWQEYELLARNITPGSPWVELHFDLEGEAFTLRVELPEQVTLDCGRLDVEGEVPWFSK